MNTEITRKPAMSEPQFPALYEDTAGDIVLATSERGGVIIHTSTGSNDKIGFIYPNASGISWQLAVSNYGWKRIRTPISITFNP